jgi:hypothetical protein
MTQNSPQMTQDYCLTPLTKNQLNCYLMDSELPCFKETTDRWRIGSAIGASITLWLTPILKSISWNTFDTGNALFSRSLAWPVLC